MTDDPRFAATQPPTDAEAPVPPPDSNIYFPGGKRPGRSKLATAAIVIFALLLLAAAGGAGWYFLKGKSAKPAQPAAAPAPPPAPTDDVAEAKDQKTYKSDVLQLQISYPATWNTPVEKDGGLTVTSPSFTYQTLTGSVLGDFHVYIRQGARDQDGKYIGAGIVTQPSEKLVYANPGASQRKDTNLSLFGAGTSSHFTFFMVSGDYQLNKEDQLGASYGREADTYIIAGGYGTKDQADDLAFQNVPLADATSKTVYTQAIDIIKSIQLP